MLLLPDFLQFTSNVLTKEISVGNLDEKIAACLWGAAWKNTIYFVAPIVFFQAAPHKQAAIFSSKLPTEISLVRTLEVNCKKSGSSNILMKFLNSDNL